MWMVTDFAVPLSPTNRQAWRRRREGWGGERGRGVVRKRREGGDVQVREREVGRVEPDGSAAPQHEFEF